MTNNDDIIDLRRLDEFGFDLKEKEIISFGLTAAEKLRLDFLSKLKRNFERFVEISKKKDRYLLTKDIKLSTDEDIFLEVHSDIEFIESEKDELKALRMKQLNSVQEGLTDNIKCGSCGKDASSNPNETFEVIRDIELHELIPLNSELCEECFSFFKPLADKANSAIEKRIFCIHCDIDLTPTIPLLSQFESKYAISGVCEKCYDYGHDFNQCSIGFEEKHTIFTREFGNLCLFHAFLKGFNTKTQEIANRKQVGNLGFGTT